jgi:hypothetical protein
MLAQQSVVMLLLIILHCRLTAHLWAAAAAAAPWLQFLRGDWFPEVLNHKIVKPVFAVVVALLFIGPQVGEGLG